MSRKDSLLDDYKDETRLIKAQFIERLGKQPADETLVKIFVLSKLADLEVRIEKIELDKFFEIEQRLKDLEAKT